MSDKTPASFKDTGVLEYIKDFSRGKIGEVTALWI